MKSTLENARTVHDVTEQLRLCFNEALETHGPGTAIVASIYFNALVMQFTLEAAGPEGPVEYLQDVGRVFRKMAGVADDEP